MRQHSEPISRDPKHYLSQLSLELTVLLRSSPNRSMAEQSMAEQSMDSSWWNSRSTVDGGTVDGGTVDGKISSPDSGSTVMVPQRLGVIARPVTLRLMTFHEHSLYRRVRNVRILLNVHPTSPVFEGSANTTKTFGWFWKETGLVLDTFIIVQRAVTDFLLVIRDKERKRILLL